MRTIFGVAILAALAVLPVRLRAQPADSLHLLWRNEAISGVTAHAFSHSGTILALANNYEIKFWDLKKGEFVRTIEIPHHSWNQMSFVPNDAVLVLLSPSFAGTNRRWDPEAPSATGGFEIRVDVQTGKASAVNAAIINKAKWSLSRDGSLIAILTDSGVLSVRMSSDFSTISTTQLPAIPASYRSSMYSGWEPPYGIWFTSNGSEVIAQWGGQAFVYNARSLSRIKTLSDSVDKWITPEVKGESVFIPRPKTSFLPQVFSDGTWDSSKLQPPSIIIPKIAQWSPLVGKTSRAKSAILLGNGKYLASRYAMWLEQLIDYGTPRGEDTLVITTPSHPEYGWGIRLSNFMRVLDVIPGNKNQLLLGDGGTLMILDAELHKVTYLTCNTLVFAGFGKDEQTLLMRDQRDLYSFGGKNWKRIGWAGAEPSNRASDASFLKGYLRALSAGDHKVFAYMDYWSKNNTAKIFDLRTGDSSLIFPAGLNFGVAAGAVSHDKKWIATVSAEGDGRVWRASDASLKLCFAAKGAYEAQFPMNDRYLLFSAVYGNDSGISLLDLKTGATKRICLGDAKVSDFELSPDGSRLAVYRWHGPGGTMGPAVIELYRTPASWQSNDPSVDPKTTYLPLRFYLPKDAPEALDTNGRPFNPPCTQAELELRYADGRLLKKILDGPLHKGKWHEWVYDMTGYPKGTYIMHTEIGGVVKDEKMELR